MALLGVATCAVAAAPAVRTISNPIVERGADPWVVRWGGTWYRAHSGQGAVWVSRFESPDRMGRGSERRVWAPEPGREFSRNLWAPEIHHLDGRWYAYVAADDGRNENHRMYVLEGDARDPQGTYRFHGRLAVEPDRWAIDGTVLTLKDGRRYFIWSGWEGTENVAQDLYLARMVDPVRLSGRRVRISRPEQEWERRGQPWVNEGPQVLWNGDRLFLVYSASGSWTDDYCLGVLEWTGGDPLEPRSWKKWPRPAFSRTETVFGPGHCCFVDSPPGEAPWIIYHSARRRGSGWDRQISMQPFGWGPEGEPEFGEPVAPGRPLELPSWMLPPAGGGAGEALPGIKPGLSNEGPRTSGAPVP